MYKEIEPLIENTICEAREKDGETISYRIRPADGYKLHEITLDEKAVDDYGNETGEVIPGYTLTSTTAGVDYDFIKNEREIYAVEV